MNANHLRLPNLVVVGVAKAGTTSLFNYLEQHPQVCGAHGKELFFFTPLLYGQELPEIETYASNFAHCRGEPVRLEATPGYYYGGRPLITEMQRVLGSHKVVLMLRDPVDRLWSYYNFERSRSNVPFDMSFASYVERCLELKREGVDTLRENNAYWGLSSGLYDGPLVDWLAAYGESMQVVFFEHMKVDPSHIVAQLFDWIGVDGEVASNLDYDVRNPTVLYPGRRLNHIRTSLRGRVGPLPRWTAPVIARIDTLLGRRTSVQNMDSEVREQLAKYYATSMVNTRQILGDAGYKNLPDWLNTS